MWADGISILPTHLARVDQLTWSVGGCCHFSVRPSTLWRELTMAATPAARAAATSALEHLLKDKVKPAEKILRSTLLQPEATLTLPARTCLLNDLALCALHDNRPGDAVDPMRHALALLPPLLRLWLLALQRPWLHVGAGRKEWGTAG